MSIAQDVRGLYVHQKILAAIFITANLVLFGKLLDLFFKRNSDKPAFLLGKDWIIFTISMLTIGIIFASSYLGSTKKITALPIVVVVFSALNLFFFSSFILFLANKVNTNYIINITKILLPTTAATIALSIALIIISLLLHQTLMSANHINGDHPIVSEFNKDTNFVFVNDNGEILSKKNNIVEKNSDIVLPNSDSSNLSALNENLASEDNSKEKSNKKIDYQDSLILDVANNINLYA